MCRFNFPAKRKFLLLISLVNEKNEIVLSILYFISCSSVTRSEDGVSRVLIKNYPSGFLLHISVSEVLLICCSCLL